MNLTKAKAKLNDLQNYILNNFSSLGDEAQADFINKIATNISFGHYSPTEEMSLSCKEYLHLKDSIEKYEKYSVTIPPPSLGGEELEPTHSAYSQDFYFTNDQYISNYFWEGHAKQGQVGNNPFEMIQIESNGKKIHVRYILYHSPNNKKITYLFIGKPNVAFDFNSKRDMPAGSILRHPNYIPVGKDLTGDLLGLYAIVEGNLWGTGTWSGKIVYDLY